MAEEITRDHYQQLAATYDQNWAYNPEFIAWMSDRIQDRLKITETDVAADIGCGTGLYTRGLAAHAAAVAGADPSPAMLAQVPVDDQITKVEASAEDLADRRVVLPHGSYDAILVKEALHHVHQNRGRVVAGLARLLRPGGRMLVVMLPKQISYPLWPEALSLYERLQPDPAAIAALMSDAGLRTELAYESFALVFETGRYLQMVRDRYMSLLAEFTDEELEAGISHIRQEHPGEQVSFSETYAFILGTAP